VYAPEAKRLQRCLSAVLNFAKHREDRAALLDELRAEGAQAEGQCEAMEQENAAMARASAVLRRQLQP